MGCSVAFGSTIEHDLIVHGVSTRTRAQKCWSSHLSSRSRHNGRMWCRSGRGRFPQRWLSHTDDVLTSPIREYKRPKKWFLQSTPYGDGSPCAFHTTAIVRCLLRLVLRHIGSHGGCHSWLARQIARSKGRDITTQHGLKTKKTARTTH